jgi:hypothetical protein
MTRHDPVILPVRAGRGRRSVHCMLTTSWAAAPLPAGPAAECTVVAARLRLRSLRDLPRFARWMLRVKRQLRAADGLLGYAFGVELSAPAVWTLSAWTRRGCLARFEGGGAHRAAKHALRGALLPSTFLVWDCPAVQLPPDWAEVRRRATAAAGLS